ncbi:type I DNA topoisomerase [bacterium]|nr:type I DNA topoisomerase [bacterium]
MKLIIVESPTKAKTITKFLGKEYRIESSFGHIRDLDKKNKGIDIENNFKPKYIIPEKSKKHVTKLKALAKKATEIILAPDEDREGEAIAWHLVEALKIDNKKTKRIVFHEITKNAILHALANPREIDIKMVNSQQARRVLDRLVGFELSPFLWKKITYGLSAGRVQSVALRLVVEREEEIKAFKPDEYWSIEADLSKLDKAGTSEKAATNIIKARLNKINDKTLSKLTIKNQKEADKITTELKGAKYIINDVTKKQTKKNPPRPFTTSTLQQTANRWLGFSAKQTMMLAQKLYEKGHITYMRTDSVFLSDKFLSETKNYLHSSLGEQYALIQPRVFKTKSKNAQEAHEAVRPTKVSDDPAQIKTKLDKNQLRLYTLIWQRSIASQMPEAILDATAIDIDAKATAYQFRATGQILKFDGYLKIYPEKSKEVELPLVTKNEELELHKIIKDQHFTKPPGRYSDAGLVKILEKYGIGRPSTYAPTIATIEARNYVSRDEQKKLMPSTIAFTVISLLKDHFQDIVNYAFTAEMENKLDSIANGKHKWQEIIKKFYEPFHKNLEIKDKEINKKDIMPEEKTNEICEKCKSRMIIKSGRFGKFLACSNYPECKNVKNLDANGEVDKKKDKQLKELEDKYKNEKCDKCGADMVIKSGKFGPFLACSAYPKCKNIKNIKENNNSTGIKCPKCNKGEIVQKRSRRGVFYACDQYPDCKTAFWGKPTGEKCPDCDSLLIEVKEGAKCSNKNCSYTK